MANSTRTLVLGAGASKTYGYPLGGELRNAILGMSESTARRTGVIDGGERTEAVLKDFQGAFRSSTLYSIDSFLGRRHEFEPIGKACIAAVLLECEDAGKLLSEGPEHWYQYLLNEITADTWDELDFSALAFITFNYDRSLETFLLYALHHGYGKELSEVAEKLRSLRIVHVYGSLGEALPGSQEYSLYDGIADPRKIEAASRHLKVIPEGRMNSETLVTAREWLSNSEHIAFLGFGFDRTNVERLSADNACKIDARIGQRVLNRTIIGTCVGMRNEEALFAYRSLTKSRYRGTGLPFKEQSCYDLLRNTLFLRR